MDDKRKTNVVEMQGKTRINVDTCSFTWTIENFSLCPCDTDECIESPSFTTGSSTITSWDLFLYPKGQKRNNSVGKVGIYLEKLSDLGSHQATYKVSIIDRDGNPCHTSRGEHLFKTKGSNKGWPSFISRDILFRSEDTLLPNDKLTVLCELKVSSLVCMLNSELKKDEKTTETANTICSLESLSADLQSLYENKRFFDFTLKVEGEEIPVHKAILAARSEVFAAMFEHDMMEKSKEYVEINDIPSDVMKALVIYMYTGRKDKLTHELAVGLHAAADKYAMSGLKAKCAQYLTSNLSVDNVCEIVLLADLHDDVGLKKEAKLFLCSHTSQVLKTEGWTTLLKENPALATEMLQAVTTCFV